VLLITLQDLRFRLRQFLIAICGAGLVFALSLLLTGLAHGFTVEIDQTVNGMGASSWVVADGAAGRVAELPVIPQSLAHSVASDHGVIRADPVLIVPQTASVSRGDERSLILVGTTPGSVVRSRASVGRTLASRGEAIVDTSLGLGIGRSFAVSGVGFRVVGTVSDRTLLGGTAVAYVSLADAQAAVFGGRPLVNAILTTGSPSSVPKGLAVLSNAQIKSASLAQMLSAVSSINNSRLFSWIIAAVIVAALVYVTALERNRDFAVLKALGASSRLLFLGLALQAVLVALAAAVLASIIANFMTGLFVQPVDIPPSAFGLLPLSAVVVGLVASLAALRRAIAVDPAMAFAGV